MFRPILTALALAPSTTFALTITLDYTYDDWFTNPSNPYGAIAQAALQAAADDVSDLITQTLGAIDTNFVVGYTDPVTAGAQITADYQWLDPRDSSTTFTYNPTLAQDEVVVLIGAQTLGNFTWGEASPAVAQVQYQFAGAPADLAEALDITEILANALFGRGGPITQSVNTTFTSINPNGQADLTFASVGGSVWFNDSPSNNSGRDAFTTHANYYHYDHTTPVGFGKIDLYSIALHEFVHLLGYGSGDNWINNVNGTDWEGSAVQNLLNSDGTDLVAPDGYHHADGLTGLGLEDGIERTTVLNPSPTTGQRDQLTDLDAAFIEDIGYSTNVPVPEPGTGLLLLSSLTLFGRRNR
ncbi:MAG: PEP-CTERM sorting domain-containing protein [Verrucomicrobiota bacterium]